MQATQQIQEIVVDNYDVNAMSQVDTNPLEVRWGFNPVQRDKILDARNCGIAKVPFARFFPIRSFKTPREQHSIDWTQPKEISEIVQAEEAQRFLEDALAGKNAQVPIDWGFRVGFFGVRDIALMEVLTQTVLPTLDTIRELCRDNDLVCPISDVCEGSDGDFGTRETCVMCWNKWVNSEACEKYCEIVAAVGLPVTERDAKTGALSQRVIKPTFQDFQQALEIVRAGFRAGIASLQTQWRTIVKEEEKNERQNITEFEDSYRKDLHENKPQDRQIAMVEKFAKASAGANNNQDVIAMLAQSQIQTNQLLGVVASKLDAIGGQAPEAAAPVQTAEEKAAFVQRMAEARRKKQEEGSKSNEG